MTHCHVISGSTLLPSPENYSSAFFMITRPVWTFLELWIGKFFPKMFSGEYLLWFMAQTTNF